MRSFLFALTLRILGTITFSPQPILLVRPLIYPANSIWSDGRRRRIWCYGDAANDHFFWWEQATTMPSFGDLRSQRRGQRGMLDPHFFLLRKDTVLHGRCQRPFFLHGNEQLRYELLVVLRPSSGFFVGVWYA